MPNHFHAMLFPTHTGTSLNMMVGEGKRFMAYDIVNGLKRLRKASTLKILEKGVDPNEKLKGKKHQVFQLSFDARTCVDESMIEQKLDYIHHNPVSGKWALVEDYVTYPHSSAQFYECDIQRNFEVTHYKDLFKE